MRRGLLRRRSRVGKGRTLVLAIDALTRTPPLQKEFYVAEGGIDTATVDIPLPDECAPEMVRDLHEANPSIPVLVMTALEDCAVPEQMLRAGADEVVEDAFTFAA